MPAYRDAIAVRFVIILCFVGLGVGVTPGRNPLAAEAPLPKTPSQRRRNAVAMPPRQLAHRGPRRRRIYAEPWRSPPQIPPRYGVAKAWPRSAGFPLRSVAERRPKAQRLQRQHPGGMLAARLSRQALRIGSPAEGWGLEAVPAVRFSLLLSPRPAPAGCEKGGLVRLAARPGYSVRRSRCPSRGHSGLGPT